MVYSIYIIENKINGKLYVGQTCNINKRFYAHKNYCQNKHLANSFKKYGLDNFDFIVLQDGLSKEEADDIEIGLISLFNTTNPSNGYNKEAGGAHGSPSEETRLKQSLAHRGKKLTEEQKRKIGEKAKIYNKGERNGMYGVPHTEEWKLEMSQKMSKENNPWWHKGNPVVQLDKITKEVIAEFPCATEAKRQTGINNSHIAECCQGKRKSAGGYCWSYPQDLNDNLDVSA